MAYERKCWPSVTINTYKHTNTHHAIYALVIFASRKVSLFQLCKARTNTHYYCGFRVIIIYYSIFLPLRRRSPVPIECRTISTLHIQPPPTWRNRIATRWCTSLREHYSARMSRRRVPTFPVDCSGCALPLDNVRRCAAGSVVVVAGGSLCSRARMRTFSQLRMRTSDMVWCVDGRTARVSISPVASNVGARIFRHAPHALQCSIIHALGRWHASFIRVRVR